MGNPQVFPALPVPLPTETYTPSCRYRFRWVWVEGLAGLEDGYVFNVTNTTHSVVQIPTRFVAPVPAVLALVLRS